ncbi:MAG TPA: biotin/lipoyl-containing protein [Candidatus Limnocylindrales bacterium]
MTDDTRASATGVAGSAAPAIDPADAIAGGSASADAELLGLIDRLAELLQRSDLLELEVESGGTGLILRKAVAQPAGSPASSSAAPAPEPPAGHAAGEPAEAGREPVVPATPSVKAPLTGIFYASPAPGSAPYVQVGGEVAIGQVIGLIEAMKLFNEIKSDLAGRVVRVLPESGALVKAKQPLIEVEPL